MLGAYEAFPTIARLKNGDYVVTFFRPFNLSTNYIEARIFGSKLNTITEVFTVATSIAVFLPYVLALQNGGFIICYMTDKWDTPGTFDIGCKIYNPKGVEIENEFLLNTNNTAGGQFFPRLCSLTNGNIVATWYDDNGDVYVAILKQDGTMAVPIFAVNNTPQRQTAQSVKCLSRGGFVIVYQNYTDSVTRTMKLQQFNENGNKIGEAKEILTSTYVTIGIPDIGEILDPPGLVVTYSSQLESTSDEGGSVQLFYLNLGVCNDFKIFQSNRQTIHIDFSSLTYQLVVIRSSPAVGQLRDQLSGLIPLNDFHPKTDVYYIPLYRTQV
jgi:hypothetical protein